MGVGNVGDFQKLFFVAFYGGLSLIASMQIVQDIQKNLADSNNLKAFLDFRDEGVAQLLKCLARVVEKHPFA